MFFYAYIHDIRGVKINKKGHLILLFLVFFLFTGLRHGNGGDTYQYRIFWDLLPTINKITWDELTSYRYEIGWVLASCLVKSIFGSFVFYQLLISALLNLGLYRVVSRYSKYPFLTLLLFYVAGEQFFWIEFEFMRQSASAAIFFLFSFKYLEEQKYIKYFISVIVCVLFHFASAFLFIFPFFWHVDYSDRKKRKKMFIALMVFFILSLISYNLAPFVLLRAYDRFANGLDDLAIEGNELIRIIHVLYYYIVYYFLILWGIVTLKIGTNFNGALFIGLIICIIGPYTTDALRLMFFIIIFIDMVLAEIIVRITSKNLVVFICGVIMFAVVSNLNFYRRYSKPESSLFLYPYYSWFEDEPKSHRDEFQKRYTDGFTIPLQIYKKD